MRGYIVFWLIRAYLSLESVFWVDGWVQHTRAARLEGCLSDGRVGSAYSSIFGLLNCLSNETKIHWRPVE